MAEPCRPSYELDALKNLSNYYAWIVDECAPFLGTRLAEIGGGIGTFTAFLARSQVQRHGERSLDVFEPDAALHRSLVDRMQSEFRGLIQAGRLRVTHGAFSPHPQRFDTVVLVNVLEHIPDDESLVRAIHRSLAPGGTVIIFVPALQRLFSPLDKAVGHLRRYEKRQLRRLLESGGFGIARATYMDMAGVITWYLVHVLGRSQRISARMAEAYDRWVVPLTSAIERRCGAFVGKNLLIIGRKPEV